MTPIVIVKMSSIVTPILNKCSFISIHNADRISKKVKPYNQFTNIWIVQFQKISILPPPPPKGIGISWGGGGSVRPKNIKKCMKLNLNFQRGGGGFLENNPSVGGGGGMDIFWNDTFES